MNSITCSEDTLGFLSQCSSKRMALAEYFVVWQCWNDLPVPSFQQLESLRSSVFLPRPPHFFVPARPPRVIMYCIRLSSASVVAPVLQAGGPAPAERLSPTHRQSYCTSVRAGEDEAGRRSTVSVTTTVDAGPAIQYEPRLTSCP